MTELLIVLIRIVSAFIWLVALVFTAIFWIIFKVIEFIAFLCHQIPLRW